MGDQNSKQKLKGSYSGKRGSRRSDIHRGSNAAGYKTTEARDQWMLRDVKARVCTIDTRSLQPTEPQVSSDSPTEIICTYNWMNRKKPTVYAPGTPPFWKQPSLPFQLAKDSGVHFIDQNKARVPDYPFEVLFAATEVMNPDYRFDDIDVLINRNSLRKFLDFCYGRKQDSFRVNLYTVKNTLIVERAERTAREQIQGSANSGYGHNFEKACTTLPAGLEESAGHHRVLRYKFGELNMAVRFEVDACYEDPTIGDPPEEVSQPQGAVREGDASLTDRFGSLQLSSAAANSKTMRTPSVYVLPRGIMKPQESTIELKIAKNASVGRSMPQLWFGRTSHFIKGSHETGVLQKVDKQCAADQFAAWESEEKNQTALRKVASLLSEFRRVVQGVEGRACVAMLEHARSGEMQIWQPSGGMKALPDDVIGKFWTVGTGEG